jgi:hypothetical protein
MDYPAAASFRKAGYTPIVTNASYTGGLVRQHGNVSFSRVFEAGHAVAAYQPETVYRIFKRTIYGRDVATGEVVIANNDSYSTSGPENSLAITNELPAGEPSICYLYALGSSCTPDELAALENGTAVVEDYVVRLPVAANGGGDGKGNGSDGGRTPKNTAGRVGAPILRLGVVPLVLGLAFLSL